MEKIVFLILDIINMGMILSAYIMFTSYGDIFPWSDSSQLAIEIGIAFLKVILMPVWLGLCLIYTFLKRNKKRKLGIVTCWAGLIATYFFVNSYQKLMSINTLNIASTVIYFILIVGFIFIIVDDARTRKEVKND